MLIQRLPPYARSVALALSVPFVFRAGHGSDHERTMIPENTSFEWNGIFTQRVTTDVALISELVSDTKGTLQWFAQLALAYWEQVLITRADLQTHATLVGDTSFSMKK